MSGIDKIKEIQKILFEEDPVGIGSITNREDEYSPEADEIYLKLSTCESIYEVQTLCFKVFVKMFDKEDIGNFTDYRVIAERIYEEFPELLKQYNPIKDIILSSLFILTGILFNITLIGKHFWFCSVILIPVMILMLVNLYGAIRFLLLKSKTDKLEKEIRFGDKL